MTRFDCAELLRQLKASDVQAAEIRLWVAITSAVGCALDDASVAAAGRAVMLDVEGPVAKEIAEEIEAIKRRWQV